VVYGSFEKEAKSDELHRRGSCKYRVTSTRILLGAFR
jgi:hypothetical protein